MQPMFSPILAGGFRYPTHQTCLQSVQASHSAFLYPLPAYSGALRLSQCEDRSSDSVASEQHLQRSPRRLAALQSDSMVVILTTPRPPLLFCSAGWAFCGVIVCVVEERLRPVLPARLPRDA